MMMQLGCWRLQPSSCIQMMAPPYLVMLARMIVQCNTRNFWSTFFSDTLFATKKAKSLQGNTCAQLFVSDKGFVAVYPMWLQSEYLLALKQFAKDVSVPEVLVCSLLCVTLTHCRRLGK